MVDQAAQRYVDALLHPYPTALHDEVVVVELALEHVCPPPAFHPVFEYDSAVLTLELQGLNELHVR